MTGPSSPWGFGGYANEHLGAFGMRNSQLASGLNDALQAYADSVRNSDREDESQKRKQQLLLLTEP